jgi:hypothetical protein
MATASVEYVRWFSHEWGGAAFFDAGRAADETTEMFPLLRGYGVGASAFIKSIGRDYLILAVTYGDGIGRYLNYIAGAMYDDTTGKIEIERAVGVVAGYQINANDQWRFNLVYGMTNNFDNAYTDFARKGFYATRVSEIAKAAGGGQLRYAMTNPVSSNSGMSAVFAVASAVARLTFSKPACRPSRGGK